MLQTWGYVSLDPADTQHRVGTVLRRHNLCVQGQSAAFRASLEHLGDGHLSVTRMSYGSSVIVEPVPERGFWVLSMPLRGQVHVAADTGQVDSRPGTASLIPSDGHVRGHWLADSRQAVLRIKEELLWEACEGINDDPDRFLRKSSPVLQLGPSAGLLGGMLQALALLDFRQYLQLSPQGSALQWAAMARLVASAVVATRLSDDGGMAPERGGLSRLRRAEAMLRDMVHAEELVTVTTLAKRLHVSVRSLQTLFQVQAGVTVVQAIREVKLLRAKALLGTGRSSVADAALACGFQHLGRFASMYEHRFGYLPSHERPVLVAAAW